MSWNRTWGPITQTSNNWTKSRKRSSQWYCPRKQILRWMWKVLGKC